MALEGPADADLCFVIGPIGKDGTSERKHADLLLHSVIKQVLERDEFKYKVKRADEDADPGMIGDRVISDIIQAPLVVADLTDLNPNAFYELGIRHSIELPTIHIAKAGTQLPFDNVAHRTIFVDLGDWHSTEQARSRLADSARAIRAKGYQVSNPITQANASFRMRQSEDPKERVLADIQERMAALETSLTKSRANNLEATTELLKRIRTRIDPNSDLTWREVALANNKQPEPTTILSFTSPAGLTNNDIEQIRSLLRENFGDFLQMARGSTGFTVGLPGKIDAERIILPKQLGGIQVTAIGPPDGS